MKFHFHNFFWIPNVLDSTYLHKEGHIAGIAGIPQVTVLSETFENESLKSAGGSIKKFQGPVTLD